MAPRGARARPACARSSSTPPGSRSRSSRRSATARAAASRIAYSREGRDHGGALETAGGIAKALPLLGDAFWIVSADVWAPDFRFERRRRGALRRRAAGSRSLWLVPNPPFHPRGDFGLDADGLGLADGTGPDGQRWTYANIALARAEMFAGIAPGHARRARAAALRRHARAPHRRRGLPRPLGERRHARAARRAQRRAAPEPRHAGQLASGQRRSRRSARRTSGVEPRRRRRPRAGWRAAGRRSTRR